MSDPTPPVDPRLTPAQLVERATRSIEMSYEMLFAFLDLHDAHDGADIDAAWGAARQQVETELSALVAVRPQSIWPCGCGRLFCSTHIPAYLSDAAALAVAPSAPDAALSAVRPLPDAHYEKNGIRLGDRVVCIDVPRLHGTVIVCTDEAVQVVWDDRTIGDLVWREDVAYNAYRLQVVRAVRPPVAAPDADIVSVVPPFQHPGYVVRRAKPNPIVDDDAPSVPASPPTREGWPDYCTCAANGHPTRTAHAKDCHMRKDRVQPAPAVSPAPQEGE
jgi:hypothetical protein